jgi:glycosyltransferase involved in cell wall biosynthesis
MRLMAAAKPVLVTDAEEWAGVPDGTVLRIDPGEPEEEELAEVLDLLAREPEMRRVVGEAARRHVEERHALGVVGERYREALALT